MAKGALNHKRTPPEFCRTAMWALLNVYKEHEHENFKSKRALLVEDRSPRQLL